MTDKLNLRAWREYKSTDQNREPLYPQIRPWENVDIPPLPLSLTDGDYAIFKYISELTKSAVQAGVRGTYWSLRNEGNVSELRAGLNRIPLADNYQVKGLWEEEVRLIANHDDFDPSLNQIILI